VLWFGGSVTELAVEKHRGQPAPRMTPPDLGALQGVIAGDVILPSSPEYEQVHKPVMARFHNVRPRAVVLCKTPTDVSETISFASRAGLETAVRSGGHSVAGLSSTRGIVIDVTPMHSVSVSGGMATVGAGARLGDLYDALQEHGLTIPAGCGPSVGIAGLTLGGGLGILGRKYGLTSDHLLGAQVVLADGRVVECDDDHHEELFWALRGAGGGQFGVVTTLVFRTVPAPAATCFHLVWPLAQAAAVIDAWQAWAPTAPEELDASLLLTATGDVDGPRVANLLGAMLGDEADTAKLLGELVARAGVDPASASRREMPHREAKRYLAELGDQLGESSQEQGHLFSKSEFFRRPLPTETIVALVENLSRGLVPGQSRHLDFLPWGGAYNRARADATAFVHRDELFLVQHLLVVDPHASTTQTKRARDWLTRAWALVHPWGTGRVYPNFPDPDLEDSGHAYYGTNYDRLLRVKAKYDPANFFHLHRELSP
jgi:FAD/FMN-containing dehydrogenase